MSFFDGRIDPDAVPPVGSPVTAGPDPHPWLHAFQTDMQACVHALGLGAAWVFQFLKDVLHGVVLDVEGIVAITVVVFAVAWLRALRRPRRTPTPTGSPPA